MKEIYTREKLINQFNNYFKNPYIIKEGIKTYLNLPHIETESSNIIPEDETLLFVNSGMVQFKNIFLNPEKSKLKRTFSIQKCIRAGGKHNDLDDVGMDSYHHTFFEMMGNWSFGDYFKKESIEMAYTLLIELGLKKEKIYVTYFCKETALKEIIEKIYPKDYKRILLEYKNGKSNLNKEILNKLDLINNNLNTDKETYEIWKTILPEDRIIKAGMKDNFWEMGETGPCGPCTEIHYDRINKYNARELVNTDQNDVIEIWNIVFMEYYRKPNKELELLKYKSVDTGMGLERVLGILNNGTNYDTHLFNEIFEKIGNELKNELINYRIIADHIRTITISLYYEIDFSNTGRGYVLRRIMRRLLRSYYEVKSESTIESLIKKVSKTLNINIKEKELNKIKEEINSFKKTLKKGTNKLIEILKTKKEIESSIAFDLTTTYGLPLDYLKDICRNKEIPLNLEKYDELMNKFKLLSMKNKKNSFNLTQSDIHKIEKEIKNTKEEFETKELLSELKFIKFMDELIPFNEIKLKELKEEECCLIFERTNFYSEKGGQIGDTGIIKQNNIYLEVLDTQRQENYTLHKIIYNKNINKLTSIFSLKYDEIKRNKIRANHTATHLLNYCLIKQSKKSVQAGSLINEEKIRFDYEVCNFNLIKIEEEINELINKELNVSLIEINKNELINKKELNITKLKNEKYPDIVRIIKIEGIDSSELCGGTHVNNLKEIKSFIIQSDTSLSKGIRRITALSGLKAEEFKNNFKQLFKKSKTIKDLEKISEKLIPLKYKKEYEIKKEEIKKLEEIKSKNFYKRISKIIIDYEIKNNLTELFINQKEEEFVSEKEFKKEFNKLINNLNIKLKSSPNKNILIKGSSFENKNKIFILLAGFEIEKIKEDLIKNYSAHLNKKGNIFIGHYYLIK